MLQYTSSPVGTFLKRNLLMPPVAGSPNLYPSALHSGEMYYAEQVQEQTVVYNKTPNVTETFYQYDPDSKQLRFWSEDLQQWYTSNDKLASAIWYTTYNVLTHVESSSLMSSNGWNDIIFNTVDNSFVPEASSPHYTLENIEKTITQYGNKDLTEAVMNHLRLFTDWNERIDINTYEVELKKLLSPETARRFIEQMKPKG